jgi:hypothetical protein
MTFTEQWERLLENVDELLQRKAEYRGLDHDDVDVFRADVLAHLRDEDAIEAMTTAAAEAEDETRTLLRRELELVNDAAAETLDTTDELPSGGPTEATPDQRLAQAQTAKDSIERLLPLPDWLRQRLGLLNQLVDLVT